MRNPDRFRMLRVKLAREGCTGAQSDEILREVNDHWEDLEAEGLGGGMDPAAAAKLADERLGDPDVLARQFTQTLRRTTYWGRHPVLSFVLLPHLALVFWFVGWIALALGANEMLLRYVLPKPLIQDPYLIVLIGMNVLRYSAIIIIPAVFWWRARRSFLSVKWGWMACGACAFHGAFQRITVQPHNLNVGYGFPPSGEWLAIIIPLAVGALAQFREKQHEARLSLSPVGAATAKTALPLLLGSLLFTTACHSTKTAQHRGWIGGEYKLAKQGGFLPDPSIIRTLPPEVQRAQSAGVLVTRLGENTPARLGGLREGDLILKAGDQPIENLAAFWKVIDASTPGSSLLLTIFREGKTIEEKIVTGRETFERWHSIGLGVFLSNGLDLLPNRDFSLVALGYKNDARRTELQNPEFRFLSGTQSSSLPQARAGSTAAPDSREGWEVWLPIINFGGHLRILSQDPF